MSKIAHDANGLDVADAAARVLRWIDGVVRNEELYALFLRSGTIETEGLVHSASSTLSVPYFSRRDL